jgi:hypothetical protein
MGSNLHNEQDSLNAIADIASQVDFPVIVDDLK